MKTPLLFLFISMLLNICNGQNWESLSSGTDNWVTTVASNNTALFAGGHFLNAGDISCNRIATWTDEWSAINEGLDFAVHSIYIDGEDIYIGGEFLNAGGIPAQRIVRYDGAGWYVMGSGLPGSVNDIVKYQNEIYIGMLSNPLEDGGTSGVKKWNGVAWLNPGTGVDNTDVSYSISALEIYDNKLFVGGFFNTAGGMPVNNIAIWDGINWTSPGNGLNGYCSALEVHNGELYAGGDFTEADGITVNHLCKWNGSDWSGVDSGVSGGIFGWETSVYALHSMNGKLYVGGNFDMAGNVPTNFIAAWNGTTFEDLSGGTNERVLCIDEFQNDLIVGGQFTTAGDQDAPYIAKWTLSNEITSPGSSSFLSISPNPCSDYFMLENPGAGPIHIRVYDTYGKQLIDQILIDSSNRITTSTWRSGIYSVISFDIRGKRNIFRITVQ